MTPLHATAPVPAGRAARYRAEGWWDSRTLADGIEAAARARPGAVAVADNAAVWSREDIRAAVDAGTVYLRHHGVGPGAHIVLVTGNTASGVVAYHAALRVGATVAVLDRRCGAAEMRAALDTLPGPVTVLVPEAVRERLLVGQLELPWIRLEEFTSTTSPGRGHGWTEPDRDTPAVVLFTSGTTGRPKGVVHSLNTLTAGAANMARITGAGEHTVLFLVSPLTSITGLMQLHLAADQHATLVLEDRFDPGQSLARMEQHGATLLGGAPVIAQRLLRAAETGDIHPLSLRTVALGGAMLPMPLLELAADRFHIEVARVYGSSEAPNTTGSLPGEPRARRLADDGVIMPGTEIRTGSTGHPQEGLLRGPALFLGYADPAHNEGAFEDGWYRSGDAMEMHEGRVTVVGRIKDVVNRNGLKISPSETDAALAFLPGLMEYASFAVADPQTGERLAVAVRPSPGSAVTLATLCAHLRAQGVATRKLPEQLVVWGGPLPRTASGKVVGSRLVMESPAQINEYAARVQSSAAEGDGGSYDP